MKKTLKNKFNTGANFTDNCEAWLNKRKEVDLIVWKGAHVCAPGTLGQIISCWLIGFRNPPTTGIVTHKFCGNMEGTEQETVVRRHRVGELMCPDFRTQWKGKSLTQPGTSANRTENRNSFSVSADPPLIHTCHCFLHSCGAVGYTSAEEWKRPRRFEDRAQPELMKDFRVWA